MFATIARERPQEPSRRAGLVGGLSHRSHCDSDAAPAIVPQSPSPAQAAGGGSNHQTFFETPTIIQEPTRFHEPEIENKKRLSKKGINQCLNWLCTQTTYQVERIKNPGFEELTILPTKARSKDGVTDPNGVPKRHPDDRRPQSIFPRKEKIITDTAKAIAKARRLRVHGGYEPEWQWPIVWQTNGRPFSFVNGDDSLCIPYGNYVIQDLLSRTEALGQRPDVKGKPLHL